MQPAPPPRARPDRPPPPAPRARFGSRRTAARRPASRGTRGWPSGRGQAIATLLRATAPRPSTHTRELTRPEETGAELRCRPRRALGAQPERGLRRPRAQRHQHHAPLAGSRRQPAGVARAACTGTSVATRPTPSISAASTAAQRAGGTRRTTANRSSATPASCAARPPSAPRRRARCRAPRPPPTPPPWWPPPRAGARRTWPPRPWSRRPPPPHRAAPRHRGAGHRAGPRP